MAAMFSRRRRTRRCRRARNNGTQHWRPPAPNRSAQRHGQAATDRHRFNQRSVGELKQNLTADSELNIDERGQSEVPIMDVVRSSLSGMCRELRADRDWLWRFVDIKGGEPANHTTECVLCPAVIWRQQGHDVLASPPLLRHPSLPQTTGAVTARRGVNGYHSYLGIEDCARPEGRAGMKSSSFPAGAFSGPATKPSRTLRHIRQLG
jgi:hypothetical protein